ncbi:MAG TPA: hypothetical protein VK158_03985 [Acidobacteriota bacterium]|nr:hypothetical protein [Acidobacteriota bacterium]
MHEDPFTIGQTYRIVTPLRPSGIEQFCAVYLGINQAYREFVQRNPDHPDWAVVHRLTDLTTNGKDIGPRFGSEKRAQVFSTTQKFGAFGYTAETAREKAKTLLSILEKAGL